MSFIINQNFDLKSPQFNFARDYFADVASLKAANENDFPDHFITNVAGTLYQLTKSNSISDITGKWRLYKPSVAGNADNATKANTATSATSAASATKATQDGNGRNIADTYLTKTNASTTYVTKTEISNAVTSTENLAASKLIVGDNNKSIRVATGSGLVKLTGGVVGYDTNRYLTSVPTATDSVLGVIKAKSIGTPTTFTETQQLALIEGFKSTTASSNRLYPVELFNNGRAFVHVPWTDTDSKYSLPTATKDALGGIKIGFTQNDSEHNYPVVLSTANQAYVKLPLATYNILNDTGQKDGLITGAERRAIHLLSLKGESLSNGEGYQLSLGGVIGGNNGTVTIPFVTTGMDDVSYGLMRGSDKNKLDSIEKGANKTTITGKVAQGDINAVSSGGVFAALSNKVDKVTGKGLSTNDFTTEYKNKLDDITIIPKSEIDKLFT